MNQEFEKLRDHYLVITLKINDERVQAERPGHKDIFLKDEMRTWNNLKSSHHQRRTYR